VEPAVVDDALSKVKATISKNTLGRASCHAVAVGYYLGAALDLSKRTRFPFATGMCLCFCYCRSIRFYQAKLQLVPTEKEQTWLLLSIERRCEDDPRLIRKIKSLLYCLYDADVLEEEVIQKWHRCTSKKIKPEVATAVREKVSEFMDWLEYTLFIVTSSFFNVLIHAYC
jgi:hypothetical protein